MNDTALVRFWAKVDKTDSCWNWKAGCFENGYGAFRPSGSTQTRAHRFSYELVNGPIPSVLQINHHCDNRKCVNPAHLYAGTQKQNREDAVKRKRTATAERHGMHTHPESRCIGEHNGNSKLTGAQVSEAQVLHSQGVSMGQLAKRYGISRQAISYHIRKGWC